MRDVGSGQPQGGDAPRGRYQLRHPTAADLAAIQRLVDVCEAAETNERRPSPVRVAVSFALPTSEPKCNWWVLTQSDAVTGFARIWPQSSHEVLGEVFADSDAAGRDLCAQLYPVIEQRARDMVACNENWTPSLFTLCDDVRSDRQAWLLARGYRRARDVFVMRIDTSRGVAAPVWPPGVEVREVRPGIDDEVLWAADVDAFREHYLYDPSPFDTWRAEIYGHPGFDPTCYLAAWAGDEVAGQALGMPGDESGAARIDDVSVRKPWRGRGLGLALLLEVLARLHARGSDDVEVWVDAENETGAVGLYEAAGMRVWRRIGIFELALEGTRGDEPDLDQATAAPRAVPPSPPAASQSE